MYRAIYSTKTEYIGLMPEVVNDLGLLTAVGSGNYVASVASRGISAALEMLDVARHLQRGTHLFGLSANSCVGWNLNYIRSHVTCSISIGNCH